MTNTMYIDAAGFAVNGHYALYRDADGTFTLNTETGELRAIMRGRPVNAKRSMFDADDALSSLASELSREMQSLAAYYDDPITRTAPSECDGPVVRAHQLSARHSVEMHGFNTFHEAMDALVQRTSDRFVYYHGFFCLDYDE